MVFDLAVSPWPMAAIQLLGLASVWLARASEGSGREIPCQCLFFICLASVALTTVLALAATGGLWALSAGTLGVMVVAATWEVRQPR